MGGLGRKDKPRVCVVEEEEGVVTKRQDRGRKISRRGAERHTTKAGCTICTTTLESLTSSAKALVQVANPPLLIE